MMSDKRKQFETIFKKFKALFPHLGNENDGEALNALRAINKLLKKAKLDWHDVLTLMAPQEDSFFDLLIRPEASSFSNTRRFISRLTPYRASMTLDSGNVVLFVFQAMCCSKIQTMAPRVGCLLQRTSGCIYASLRPDHASCWMSALELV